MCFTIVMSTSFLSLSLLPLLSTFFPVSVLTTSAAISGQDDCWGQLGELHEIKENMFK